jgi:hypothetical protein
MYPVPWSREAGRSAGIATGVGICASGDRKVLLPDGFRKEMACRTNQFGSIVSTSREALDEGKVRKYDAQQLFCG